MSDGQVIEGTATETEPGHEIVPVRAPAAVLAVTPQVKASELVERLAVVREAMDTAMQEDIDYGVIPGTNKPALLKPGAEKLSVLFQLDVQLVNEKVWGPGDHLTVMSHATVHHAPTGSRLGYGEGLCTTREKKYAYRKQERTCPSCGAQAIIKGKAEYGGGWVCWKKRDGCNSKFPENAPEIVNQDTADIDNPDLPDLWNTVVKMAEKRARVDAVLAVTGASALFTQDIEDQAPAAPPAPPQKATDVPFDADEPTAQAPIDATVEPTGAGPTCTDAQARLIHMRAKGIDPQTVESILRSAAGASSPEAVPKALVDQVLERLAAAPKAA